MKDKTDEIEKAWLIFAWIAMNISYDYEGLKDLNNVNCNPENVFEKKIGICSGYSQLFKKMAD